MWVFSWGKGISVMGHHLCLAKFGKGHLSPPNVGNLEPKTWPQTLSWTFYLKFLDQNQQKTQHSWQFCARWPSLGIFEVTLIKPRFKGSMVTSRVTKFTFAWEKFWFHHHLGCASSWVGCFHQCFSSSTPWCELPGSRRRPVVWRPWWIPGISGIRTGLKDQQKGGKWWDQFFLGCIIWWGLTYGVYHPTLVCSGEVSVPFFLEGGSVDPDGSLGCLKGPAQRTQKVGKLNLPF